MRATFGRPEIGTSRLTLPNACHALKSPTATNRPRGQNACQRPSRSPWTSCRCMIIIGRIVAAFSAVTSNPIMHQQHRAMIVPFWSRKKLKPSTSASGDRLADRFVVHRRTSGADCSRGTFTHSG